MILVADSGSSKTDWILSLPGSEKLTFHSSGINPFFLTDKDITNMLMHTPEIQPYVDQVEEIYFFGAGCSSPDKHEVVSNGLSGVFKNAFISVDNDMIGSAYATCGHHKGLTCILGTGSNISFFDGQDVQPGFHGLGYILGDEGSGSFFGKKLITGYLNGQMPVSLQKPFKAKYDLTKDSVIHNVYKRPLPNRYLASFARFMAEHREHPYVEELLKSGFREFVKSHVLPYPNYREYNCHFVGSIAFHFQDALRNACEANGVHVGKVLEKPIVELYEFILKQAVAG
ncbi:N-acetylglucosamine kinase [Hufsiella ginkgonis]|uniref:N-acetylglucosamine kinase n=1 Tax=Hufsiella ginkgonis TaxID=2695274 RepID=A0A7K1XSL5_9SPHI|nr:N-acetylglucosamine kinase [Hufsiella ginkgonis]MXV13942.1 N-acetylglucosamine kinase [Hufsiella ginkgonis]